MEKKRNIAIVILAAGASRRLGQAKQLVEYQGEPLLRRMVRICLKSGLTKTFAVLGSNAEKIRESIADFSELEILVNPNWSRGMGNTIAYAANEILLLGKFEGVCFVLSDQIYFEAKLLRDLVAENDKSGHLIILSKYKNGQGPPCYFDQSIFRELAELDGDDGAKAVVKKNKDKVGYIEFPLGEEDVDVLGDLKKL